jgi:hypothetical protein
VTEEPQPFDPSADLLEVAERVTAPWLRRSLVQAAAVGGHRVDSWTELDDVIASTTTAILDRLRDLLATDVDEQRTNPLSIYRSNLGPATELLRRRSVSPPPTDRFSAERLPDDPYRLGPAAWTDIDPDLHAVGLVWGAWKAKTILDRRRDEGQR